MRGDVFARRGDRRRHGRRRRRSGAVGLATALRTLAARLHSWRAAAGHAIFPISPPDRRARLHFPQLPLQAPAQARAKRLTPHGREAAVSPGPTALHPRALPHSVILALPLHQKHETRTGGRHGTTSELRCRRSSAQSSSAPLSVVTHSLLLARAAVGLAR